VGDYSLSLLAGYKPNKIIDVGAGFTLSRLLPLDPKQTTPRNSGNIIWDKDGMNPVLENGDTLFYTFKGAKLMARCSFDPKQLFPSPTMPALQLSPEDGKIYAEYAILGLKNQGTYFHDLKRRMPYMIGVNVPTYPAITYALLPGPLMWGRYHKLDWETVLIGGAGLAAGIGSTFLELTKGDYFKKKLRLDVLSIEVEYFDFNYDQFAFPPSTTSPKDNMGIDNLDIQNRLHWSLIAQKTVVNGLSVKMLVGKDHYRNTGSTTPWAGVDNPLGTGSNVGGGEFLVARGDWHYSIRVMYSF